jgi:hypothetical protein
MPSTFPLAVVTMGFSLCPAAALAGAACKRHTIQQDMGKMPVPRNVLDKAFFGLC